MFIFMFKSEEENRSAIIHGFSRWREKNYGNGGRAKMGRKRGRDAYLHESRRSFVLISRELARFLNSAEIAAKWIVALRVGRRSFPRDFSAEKPRVARSSRIPGSHSPPLPPPPHAPLRDNFLVD